MRPLEVGDRAWFIGERQVEIVALTHDALGNPEYWGLPVDPPSIENKPLAYQRSELFDCEVEHDYSDPNDADPSSIQQLETR